MDDVYALLKHLSISYERFDHSPVFTVAETDAQNRHLPGAHTKNLFLKNEKGTHYYLYVLDAHTRADIRALARLLDEKHLRFGSPEELKEFLGVTPGSVSLLALMHDTEKRVQLLIDERVWKSSIICCHPNVNTVTLALRRDDVATFFSHTGHTPRVIAA